MINSEQIRTRIEQLLQQSPFAALSDDLRILMKSQLTALLNNADLVSREEFEVQAEALRRTRATLAELEEKVARLEQQGSQGS